MLAFSQSDNHIRKNYIVSFRVKTLPGYISVRLLILNRNLYQSF